MMINVKIEAAHLYIISTRKAWESYLRTLRYCSALFICFNIYIHMEIGDALRKPKERNKKNKGHVWFVHHDIFPHPIPPCALHHSFYTAVNHLLFVSSLIPLPTILFCPSVSVPFGIWDLDRNFCETPPSATSSSFFLFFNRFHFEAGTLSFYGGTVKASLNPPLLSHSSLFVSTGFPQRKNQCPFPPRKIGKKKKERKRLIRRTCPN